MAVSNCKVVNQSVYFNFLNILNVFFQFIESSKQLEVVRCYRVLAVRVLGKNLRGDSDSLGFEVADEGFN